MIVVSVDNISKAFRGDQIFEHVSMQIEQGRTYGLVGPNGSGKSVLLKLLCGFLLPDQGSVKINSKYLSAGRVYPDKFGVAIDGPAYMGHLSAERNLAELAAIRRTASSRDIKSVLEEVGLHPKKRQKARTFSLGMKQKLSIAQALLEDPEVLILDEPFNGLDIASVELVKTALKRRINEGVTVVFTSHHSSDIADLADTVFRIDGRNVLPN